MMGFFRRLLPRTMSRTPKSGRGGDVRSDRGGLRKPSAGAGRTRPAARLQALESRALLAGVPYGALAEDTAEYLIGDVHVNVVFMESTGAVDPSTEDWTAEQIAQVKQRVVEGVSWWKDALAQRNTVHELDFHFDFTYADTPFPTRYEPISRYSYDYRYWVQEFLDHVGFGDVGALEDRITKGILAFNHASRLESNSNWAFTIFVVNAENDADGGFTPPPPNSGGFSNAFGFAGGRFLISPSRRPASTYAHEMGHIFYALDEHGATSYDRYRGYYNTRNLNAVEDRPASAGEPVVSIMAVHQPAFPIYAISPSAAEMVGWRDSDGDGVFDVLDVPLSLTGSGGVDPVTGRYRFVGQASVGALPNRNTSGHQSDITINQVSRIQYRIDGGPWTDVVTPHAYQVDLDFTFPVPAGLHDIEIRALDDATNEPGETGVVSPTFHGTTGAPSAVAWPGLNGFLWNDIDGDGLRDANERPLAGWTVEVRGPAGQPLNLRQTLEPDDYADEQDLAYAHPGVTLKSIGTGVGSSLVSVRTRDAAATGSRVFAHQLRTGGQLAWSTEWTDTLRELSMEFTEPVSRVSLDAVANSDFDLGRLEIYDANWQMIGRVTTGPLSAGESATMTLSRPTAEIKYALAMGHAGTGVRLDNLRFGPETTAVTDALGAWSVPHLDHGAFTLHVAAPANWDATNPAASPVMLGAGQAVENLNLGFRFDGSAWHNPTNPADVNGDNQVTIHDLLAVVQRLREHRGLLEGESGENDFYIDTDGDGSLTANDLLVVSTQLRWQIEQQLDGEGAAAAEAPPADTSELAASWWAEAEIAADAAPAVQSRPAAMPNVLILEPVVPHESRNDPPAEDMPSQAPLPEAPSRRSDARLWAKGDAWAAILPDASSRRPAWKEDTLEQTLEAIAADIVFGRSAFEPR